MTCIWQRVPLTYLHTTQPHTETVMYCAGKKHSGGQKHRTASRNAVEAEDDEEEKRLRGALRQAESENVAHEVRAVITHGTQVGSHSRGARASRAAAREGWRWRRGARGARARKRFCGCTRGSSTSVPPAHRWGRDPNGSHGVRRTSIEDDEVRGPLVALPPVEEREEVLAPRKPAAGRPRSTRLRPAAVQPS